MNIISPGIFTNKNTALNFRGGVDILSKPSVGVPSGSCLRLFNDIYQKSKGNEVAKKVPIEDKCGNIREGVIIRQRSEEEKALPIGSQLYAMYINGLKAGTIHLSKDPKNRAAKVDGLYVKSYSGDRYKGVGTELLKFAVEHSIDEGFEGRLSLCASNDKSPVGFYYKNNLRISRKLREAEYPALTARVDYAVRHNLEPEQVLNFPNNLCLNLDKMGAHALLAGKRLCDNTLSETMYSKTFEGKNGHPFEADIDFCDLTNDYRGSKNSSGDRILGEYVIQIIKKGTGKDKHGKDKVFCSQIADLLAVKTKNKEGKPVLTVKNVNIAPASRKLKDILRIELLTAFGIKADELGIEELEFDF